MNKNLMGIIINTKLILLINALVFVYAAAHSIFLLSDLTIPEGAVIYSILGIVNSSWPLYRDFTLLPFSTTPYTPLFYLASAGIATLTAKTVVALYACARFLSFFATIMAAFFVMKISLRIYAVERDKAIISALLPLTVLTLIPWGFSARPDMLALLISLMGIYCHMSTQLKYKIGLCAILLVLAWWTKQSFIAAPAAVFLSLCSEKKFKQTIAFVATYTITLLLLCGASDWLSNGLFYKNIITANVTILKINQLNWLPEHGFVHAAPFIVMMLFVGVIAYRRLCVHDYNLRCINLYLLGSVLLNTLASLKDGAYLNYMIEPLFIACVPALLGIQKIMHTPKLSYSLPILLIISLMFSYHSYWRFDGALETVFQADSAEINSDISDVIKKAEGLSGDVFFFDAGMAVRANKPVLAIDLFNIRYLQESGKLSTARLEERIYNHELGAIVAPESCLPSEENCSMLPTSLQKAMIENYVLRDRVHHQTFWYPKL